MKHLLGYIKGDKVIWVVIIILCAFSLLAVYSASGILVFKQKEWNTGYYMFRHLIMLLTGIFFMYLVHLMKFTYFSKIAQVLYLLSIPLLFYTLFWGIEINQARRWVGIEQLGLTFQTSEMAKIAIILFIARVLAIKGDEIKEWKSAAFSLFMPIFLVIALIFPADNSTAGLLLLVCLLMLYYGGVSMKILTRFGGYTLVGLVVVFLVLMLARPDSTRIETLTGRINTFLFEDIEPGSHEEQAKIAIANGKIFGKLPGHSTQKYKLPHPYSDSLYAFFIEEYGFLGGLILMLLYLILLFRGIRIAMKAPGKFSGLSALGITMMLVLQAFVHIMVAAGLFPMTGQPLPLVSMGGTSMMFTFFAFGILLSISREVYSNEEETMNEHKTV